MKKTAIKITAASIIISAALFISCSFESSFVDLIQDKINTDLGITGEAEEPEITIKLGSTELASVSGTYSFGHMHNDGYGGYASGEITFTIENSGTADLAIVNVSLSSGDTADFDLSDETSASVTPSGSTTFTVRFDPLYSGNKSATG